MKKITLGFLMACSIINAQEVKMPEKGVLQDVFNQLEVVDFAEHVDLPSRLAGKVLDQKWIGVAVATEIDRYLGVLGNQDCSQEDIVAQKNLLYFKKDAIVAALLQRATRV